MDKQAAFWLDALGANGELSATMKHELDTQGYTICAWRGRRRLAGGDARTY
ncbi:Uncharacterised protein [Kluyvera cryocrescens]|uniref:Uncharacterized protein n=1 Tax=Kluyvera cryocrescens TaxID=580 RepID=A0A485AW80_KLUCR|nr:Uncharacterised protein [Kluyvera cryocrescens]